MGMGKQLMRRIGAGASTPRSAASVFGALKDAPALQELEKAIIQRKQNPNRSSYTSKLVRDPKKIRKKLLEEAVELITARGRKNVVWEAADLLYFTTVFLVNRGVGVSEVMGELLRRRTAEKGGKDGQRYAPLRD
jgi:phosphoribosyl-ATP pyrophosphohydrolase